MAVVLLGTLDTKGVETMWVRDQMIALGTECIVVDTGVLGAAAAPADYSREAVAAAGGTPLLELERAHDRGSALRAMAEGALAIVTDLVGRGQVDGLLCLGGSGGSSIAAFVMAQLPVGVPKLLVSTMVSGDVSPYVGQSDVTLMYSVVDIAGINVISRQILGNAAAAMSAMATAYRARTSGRPAAHEDRPLVAATMFGVTTPAVEHAREYLEAVGYEVLVFHATGAGGRSMEALVRSGYFVGVLDLTTTELADEVVGGVLSAGPDRLNAAAQHGVPQVVSLGAIDMVNFGPRDTVPSQFESRTLFIHNDTVTLMRTSAAEAARIGAVIGEKLARAKGPAALYIPAGGTSAIDVTGGPFWDPDADAAAREAVRHAVIDSAVEVFDSPSNINDSEFARAMAKRLHELIQGEN